MDLLSLKETLLLSRPGVSIFIFLVSISSAAASEKAVIRYITPTGSATLLTQGKSREAKEKDTLSEGDTLSTHKGTIVILTVKSGPRLKINPDSEISIKSLSGSPEINLTQGHVFARLPKTALGPKSAPKFKLNVKGVVMGVRGTLFFAALTPPKGDLWMCVKEGVVHVSRNDQSSVDVAAGEGLSIVEGDNLPKPKHFEWPDKLNWQMEPAAEGSLFSEGWLKKAREETH